MLHEYCLLIKDFSQNLLSIHKVWSVIKTVLHGTLEVDWNCKVLHNNCWTVWVPTQCAVCDNEKFQHCQGQVTFLLLSILTWVLRKHQDDFNRSQTQFLLFADQLNWLGKWNTRATDTCLLSLERVTLLVSKCLWTENTCLQFISAAEQFKLLRFYQCPGHHVLSIN